MSLALHDLLSPLRDLGNIGQRRRSCGCYAVMTQASLALPAVEAYDFEHSRASRVELPALSRRGRGPTAQRGLPRWMPLPLYF